MATRKRAKAKAKTKAQTTPRRRRLRSREAQLAFEALSLEGGLLSPEWLSKVAQLSTEGQSETDYRVPKGLNLRDEIGRYWRIAQAHWQDFTTGVAAAADAKSLAERFVVALLREGFGYSSLAEVEPAVLAERSYPIGHAALGGRLPVVIAPADTGLDALAPAFGDGSRRRSAFGLAQEFLNAEDAALWGIAIDGIKLRVLRDNASLTRPAWIEADLRRIFTEERYADFAALWLLIHETRFGREGQPVTDCSLEAWRNAGREEGTRAREHLRRGVEEALVALGQGFLAHPENQAVRSGLQSGSLTPKDYMSELLRLVYRLIFLLTVEERNLLHPEGTTNATKTLYTQGYSLRRLRERSVKRSAHDRFSDLWEATKIVFRGVATGEPRLGLPALAGIFAKSQCPALDAAKLENRALLLAVFKLAWLREDGALARVNWRDMGPEELGSVYESLLELVPQITTDGRQFAFATGGETKGNARKTTGSYYTPDSLVQVLLDSALEPVIADTLTKNPEAPVDALLGLSIVDPACGSGHFLLAAARRLASHVARIQANGTPSATEYRHALRQVVGRCIYGVDLNPMAVELCKVSLWMEAVEPGLPLTFLNSHVQHGNALLGTTPDLMEKGIPDAAWKPIEGDDKKTASALKKRNKAADKVEYDLFAGRPAVDEAQAVARAVAELETASDADPEALAHKESQWDGILGSSEYRHQKFVADAWCAAFVWPKQAGELADSAPTNELWRQIRDGHGDPPALTTKTASELAEQYRFFHWHLQFPQVFAKGGFDVVLGNPPWIAHAGRAAQPLPPGVKHFYETNYEAFADYPTTHGVFASAVPAVLRYGGRLGLVIPSSLSELGGYAPTRAAHDRLCDFDSELTDFGEGCFVGVTQPCMALISHRTREGRRDAAVGEPWPIARPDLTPLDRHLLQRLAAMPTVPSELFGERGIQSDKALATHFAESKEPVGRFTTPIREGTDVREFEALPPRYHVDSGALAGRLRAPDEFRAVRVLVRQTARYPIAALSDGLAFRNSLLAGFDVGGWPPEAVVALLNSALVRWAHYMRFRDARQPVMPQLKIGHLRSIPVPPNGFGDRLPQLAALGAKMTDGVSSPSFLSLRASLDRLVADAYDLTALEVSAVNLWHEQFGPKAREPAGAAEGTAMASSKRRGRLLKEKGGP
ncbi:Eco57I restriction-modification methylase domain-containing protein [Myxococcota bacterium]